ncbi:MAG: hypothetical protein V1841_02115 [Patescibacteria group bacterium]
MNDLEESIFKTVIYFDGFSRPLKEKEVLENLQTIDNKEEVFFQTMRESLNSIPNLEKKGDFCFLKGRENLVEERTKREAVSRENFLKIKRIAEKINFLPFIKGVFVSGSLSIYNSDEKSDIDLLIVSKSGRIFTVRFFLTLLLSLMGVRKTRDNRAGRVCLNHFLAEDNLKMSYPSLYNAYSYLHLLPILNRDNVFEKFREKNEWMKRYLQFADMTFSPPFKIEEKSKTAMFLEKIFSGALGDWLEKRLKLVQVRRKERNYPLGVKKGRVILDDKLIELHPDSPEKKILESYQQKINDISLRI